MMYWTGEWSWVAWVAMTATMVVFWVVITWVVVALVRRPTSDLEADPEGILAQRFARGEIDDDDYRHRRDALRANR